MYLIIGISESGIELFTYISKNVNNLSAVNSGLYVIINIYYNEKESAMSIYNIEILKTDGTKQSLKEFEGKVMLVVNTATHCGFTSQYNELRDLHAKYADKGLVILDFPCNQFGAQAAGTDDEIAEFCTLNFGTPYEIYAKIDVNGENETELFKFLKSKKGFKGFNNENHPKNTRLKDKFSELDPNYESTDEIKWNFTKFLIDRNGEVVERFEPVDDIAVTESVISSYL